MTELIALGGESDFSPNKLANGSRSDHVPGESLSEMMCEDLVAERIAIDSRGHIIRYLGADDPTIRRMLEDILANEEDHAHDLASMLDGAGRKK